MTKTSGNPKPASATQGTGLPTPRSKWQRALAAQPFSERTRSGALFLLAVLAVLSVLAGMRFEPAVVVLSVGEIAPQNITATQDMLVEEKASTEVKREEAARKQPPVFDLSLEKARGVEHKAAKLFAMLNESSIAQLEQVRWQIAEQLNADVSRQTLAFLRLNETQNLIFIRILPWIEDQMRRGVVLDSRLLQRFDNGIVVRDAEAAAKAPPADAEKYESLRLDTYQILDLAGLKRRLDDFLRQDLNVTWRSRKALVEFLDPLLEPNLTMNPELSRKRVEQARAAVDPVYYNIKRGEVIVRAGQRVDSHIHLKLQAVAAQEQESFEVVTPLGIFLLGLLFYVALTLRATGPLFKALLNRDAVLIGSILLLFAAPARLLSAIDTVMAEKVLWVTAEMFPYSYPLAGAAGLLALFLSTRQCIFSYLLLTFMTCQMIDAGLNIFLFFFLSCLLQMMLIKRSETRAQVFRSVLPLLGGMLLIWLGVHLLQFQGLASLGVESLFVMVSALLSLLVVFALSPIAEMALGYTSRFRLMELMNLEQPLLQELMVTVPGTYHHSLVVSNMAEAGARAINANALLCKVAALYHDIGKIKNPHYFIENQFCMKNPHDKLAPSMSALILIAHVKKGVELATQHKLGPEITDIIQQHHGRSVIAYFYAKAMDLTQGKGLETIRDEDFRYPGPKPQTKEAGIVMLADAIEAAGRTLTDPTPARIKGHIDGITRKIFSEGQLDESQLTLKDLHLLSKAFERILTGIFHQRIEYPFQRARQQPGKPDAAGECKPGQPSPGQERPQKPALQARPKEPLAEDLAEGESELRLRGPLQ